MPVIDTSVLVALANQDDAHHGSARRLVDRPGPFLIPAVILHEFVTVMGRRTAVRDGRKAGHAAARRAYQNVAAEASFRVNTDFDLDYAGRLFLGHGELTYADAIAVAVAHRTRDELLTFDAAQQAAFDAA